MPELPSLLVLVDLVRSGQVVLFLGAGASFGAVAQNGQTAPSGADLAKLLSDRFLGGRFGDRSLATIADLAVSESDLRTVQDFIADRLRGLKPAPHHMLIPQFRWHGIVTTNYDRLVEAAYEATTERIQELGIFLSDLDRVEDVVRSPDHLLLVKLHGCITRTADVDLPLIITPDQYVTHKLNRRYLFNMFEQWGRETPVATPKSSTRGRVKIPHR